MACEVPCVRFQKVVWLASLAATLACPSFRQHSVLGGWLDLSIQFFRSEPCHVCFMPSLRTFTPEPTTFAWRTANQFLTETVLTRDCPVGTFDNSPAF